MKSYKLSQKNKKVHFIGIGGVNMSGLAKHLIAQGFAVSGSDICTNNLAELKSLGITVYDGHSQKNLQNVDVVIYTSAVSEDNPELKFARENNIAILKRSELLGQIMDEYKISVAISGSHGKTTTTDMIANMLINANLSPTVFLGGEDKNFGNYISGTGDIIIAEACEYQRNFLDLHPKIEIVLNIDNDHLDTYKDIEQTVKAFCEFSKNSISIINVDDKMTKRICNISTISFAKNGIANYTAKKVWYNGKGYSFTVYSSGRRLGRIRLNIAGEHNVYNALSVVAVGELLKVPFNKIKTSLENFLGVKRRNEFVGKVFGMDVFCDYAHHPKEILAMLLSYEKENKDFITIFQPHTYSRTRLLINEFIDCFNNCSPLIIYKTYPARETFDELGSAKTLYQQLNKHQNGKDKKIYYANDEKELEILLKACSEVYKKAVFLGAGDIYDLAKHIVSKKCDIC